LYRGKGVIKAGTIKSEVMSFGENNRRFCDTFIKLKPKISIDEGLKKKIDYYR
jgi:hypothetical protein